MKTDNRELDAILSVLGIVAPAGMLADLKIGEYLGQLDDLMGLAAGERLRLGELLRAAERITPEQLEVALAEQARSGSKLGDVLVARGLLTPRERDIVLEFQRHQAGGLPAGGKLYLGNILVATGQITRDQLQQALQRQASSGRRLGDELVQAGLVSKAQVEGGLLLQRKLVSYALAVALAFASLAGSPRLAHADQPNTAKVQVSARIAGFFRVQVQHQAAALTVTPADIERGYVDVAAGSRFSIATNTRDAYLIDFFPTGDLFRTVHIRGLNSALELPADGGSVAQYGSAQPNAGHELGYRFMLRADLKPGSYPWPLTVAVHPL